MARRISIATIATMGVTVLVVIGASGAFAKSSRPASAASVFVGGPNSFTGIDVPHDRVAFTFGQSVATPDWSRFVTASPSSGYRTAVVLRAASTGQALARETVVGRWTVRSVTRDGNRVLLLPAGATGGAYSPIGRTSTHLTLITLDRRAHRTVVLDGNYEPEAFTADGKGLVVLEYTPKLSPHYYQVRLLDLTKNKVRDLRARNGGTQEVMQGHAVAQALSPDGRRLYTYYVRAGDGSTPPEAFVHTLDLEHKWAECVDLPSSFVTDSAAAAAVSPDGRHLYVAAPRAGVVAAIDTRRLGIERTAPLEWFDDGTGGPASAAVDRDGNLVVAAGARVRVVGSALQSSLAVDASDYQIWGVGRSRSGHRVFLGTTEGVAEVDAANARIVRELDLQLGNVDHLAPGLAPLSISGYPEKQ